MAEGVVIGEAVVAGALDIESVEEGDAHVGHELDVGLVLDFQAEALEEQIEFVG